MEYLKFSSRPKLPVIHQTEATECGLACLTMIANYYGHKIDLNTMRSRYPVSLSGVLLDTLMKLGNDLELGGRALKVDLDNLIQLQTPAILHWNLNHFVVLKSVTRKYITIHDPARGVRKLTAAEVSKSFTGVALEILPTQSFKPQNDHRKMRLSSLWSSIIGLKRAIIQTLILSIILQLLVLASPFYLQLVVDEAIVKYDKGFLFVLAIGFAALVVIRSATSLLRSWIILYFGHQLSFQMVANVFRHLLYLPTSYFEKRHVGDIISRIGSTGPIQKALTQNLVAAIIDGIMAIVTGIVIFFYSIKLGFIVIISVVLLAVVTFSFYPILRRTQEETIIAGAVQESHVIESIRASTTIKLFSAQSNRLASWRNLFADTINADIKHNKYQLTMTTISDIISGLQTILVVYFGARLILEGTTGFSVGMLFAFMSFRQSFTQSVSSFIGMFIDFKLLDLHLERLADISLSETEGIEKSLALSGTDFSNSAAKIEFRNVKFRYSESDPWVLAGVNFTIEPGDFVTFIGVSGGGKSTLLKLILGLYLPTEGEVLIDGLPLNKTSQLNWRQRIGVVMQDDQLMTGTIAENISFFDAQVDMDRVHACATLARIHKDILKMPMAYFSFIGDMGSVLSSGQKQRVLLARAMYKNPKTILLDEGTANVDEMTEKLIVDSISDYSGTRIVVAHRPEFIKRTDRIFEVTAGRVIEKKVEINT